MSVSIPTYETLKLSIQRDTLIITINRPDALNALNHKVISELEKVLRDDQLQDHYKGILITGSGEKAFVAGADIQEISQIADEEEAAAFSMQGSIVFNAIEQSEYPVIAAVNGFALGGGCELAMACHLRTASPNAKFGQPEVSLGLIAGFGGTQRLQRLIGRGRALEMLLTGNPIDAQTASNWGLVNHIYAQDELIEKSLDLLNVIYTKSPVAVALTIFATNAAYATVVEEKEEELDLDNLVELDYPYGYYRETMAFAEAAISADAREGTRAFLEKRKPKFLGY